MQRQEITATGSHRNDRIVMVRLLCIFGMIYVHVPSLDNASELNTANSGIFFYFHAFMVDGFGRASACLLSVVSGYLCAITLASDKVRLGQMYRRRFQSIYLPMITWGFVTLAAFSTASLYQDNIVSPVCGAQHADVSGCLNLVLHWKSTGIGPTLHLAFLRDLFVCMLISPLLVAVLRRVPLLALAALLVAYLIDFSHFVILRPLVLLGFCVGLALFIHAKRIAHSMARPTKVIDNGWLLWIVLSALLVLCSIAFNEGLLPQLQWLFAEHNLDARESLLYPLTRVFGALAVWSLSLRLLESRMLSWSRKLEPVLFVVFCSHPLLFSLIQGLAEWTLPEAALHTWYPVWFALAPVVAFAASMLCVRASVYCWPDLQVLITGGRHIVATQGLRTHMGMGQASASRA